MNSEALQILIVEDQFLIAKQLEYIIVSCGHIHVGTAANRPTASALARSQQPDIALVDLSLADGPTGKDVADEIASVSNAKVLFLTANRRRIYDDFGGAIGVFEKPFTRAAISAVLSYLAWRLDGSESEPDEIEKPEGLDLSPAYARRWYPEVA
ncbi:MAG: response regulator [Methylobacterium sp.]|uniref:response regulator n=1 Tax=Methylobacterium sp. TaxID=409 RepID=UPI0025D98F18|nr:response regulator [Methylobacterium sp.]MBX9931980.1 response regulator [Methylobacterium sp.]